MRLFAKHMDEFLLNLPFRILVVEQLDNQLFNRGALLNVGFQLAPESEYVVFHDVDMLPVDSSCSYERSLTGFCHVAGRVEQYGYLLPYTNYCGGVLIASRAAFCRVNGFSNQYWGWGCEDDDILARVWRNNIVVERRPGLYKSLPHKPAPPFERRANQLRFERILQKYAYDRAEHPVHPKIFRRAALNTFRHNVQEEQPSWNDGMSTICFTVHIRQSLSSYLGNSTSTSPHKVAGVSLEMRERYKQFHTVAGKLNRTLLIHQRIVFVNRFRSDSRSAFPDVLFLTCMN